MTDAAAGLEILLRDGAFELEGDGRRRAAALAARVGHMALELYAAVKKQKLPKKTNPGMVVGLPLTARLGRFVRCSSR